MHRPGCRPASAPLHLMTVASTLLSAASAGRATPLKPSSGAAWSCVDSSTCGGSAFAPAAAPPSPARLALSYHNPSRRRSRRVNLNSRRRRLPDSRASSPRSCPSAATSRSPPRLAQRPRDDQQGHRRSRAACRFGRCRRRPRPWRPLARDAGDARPPRHRIHAVDPGLPERPGRRVVAAAGEWAPHLRLRREVASLRGKTSTGLGPESDLGTHTT